MWNVIFSYEIHINADALNVIKYRSNLKLHFGSVLRFLVYDRLSVITAAHADNALLSSRPTEYIAAEVLQRCGRREKYEKM